MRGIGNWGDQEDERFRAFEKRPCTLEKAAFKCPMPTFEERHLVQLKGIQKMYPALTYARFRIRRVRGSRSVEFFKNQFGRKTAKIKIFKRLLWYRRNIFPEFYCCLLYTSPSPRD